MSSLKQKLVMGWDITLMLLNMTRMVFNPKDISPIFKGRTFRNHRSFQVALASLHADPETHALIESRYLAPKPIDLDALAQLPEGTLGRVFAEHMRHYKLEVVFYPPLEDQENDDITYLRKRARQTHDIHHVVLGFPATEPGEMMISAFYLAQNKIPLSGLLLGFGFFHVVLKAPERADELVEAIIKGWTLGKAAHKKVLGVKWEEYWEVPIDEVRRMIGVEVATDSLPPEPQAVAG